MCDWKCVAIIRRHIFGYCKLTFVRMYCQFVDVYIIHKSCKWGWLRMDVVFGFWDADRSHFRHAYGLKISRHAHLSVWDILLYIFLLENLKLHAKFRTDGEAEHPENRLIAGGWREVNVAKMNGDETPTMGKGFMDDFTYVWKQNDLQLMPQIKRSWIQFCNMATRAATCEYQTSTSTST